MGISYCDHGWSVFNEEPCPECVAVRPTSNPPALPAGNLLADSYIADLAQLATERFPLDEEMRYYAGRLRNGVVKLLAERTALAAAEQRAASMAARIAGFDPCAIDLENTSFIVCFFCGANLDCDAETPLEQQAHRSLCLWLEAKAASPTTGGEGVGDGH